SCYPADHIGRPVGQARANPNSNTNIVHLAAAPEHSWSADSTALGTADFRSSKTHILSASLRAPNGCGLALNSDGSQTTRAFVAGDCIGWLIAAINAGGGDSFFAPHFGPDQHPLPKGSHLADTIHLQLFNHP
ncbi:MAG TPA: hypothetical protein VL970_06210, partial [Candidatus Acidoferrales bacterium]|nr:hypothetical protein [Candidatus Acidoferrales bacterium]